MEGEENKLTTFSTWTRVQHHFPAAWATPEKQFYHVTVQNEHFVQRCQSIYVYNIWPHPLSQRSEFRVHPPVSDASPECLVESSECLNVVPLTPGQQATLPAVLVIVLPLQLHLGAGQGAGSTDKPHPLHTCLSLMLGKGIPTWKRGTSLPLPHPHTLTVMTALAL